MVVARKTESKLSHANDSVEDLLIISVSETESVDGDTYPVPRSTQRRVGNCALVTSVSAVGTTKGCGKRKRRQYENFVDLLSKGPVEFHIPTIHDFLPMGHRSLLSLLEECSIFEAFCYGCEDFLEKLGGNCGRFEKEGSGRWRSIKSFGISASSQPLMSDQTLLEKKSLCRVEESVRSALISGKISQDLVKDLEDKLLNFFISNPRETFMSRGLSSLQRMALCAICNFHLLLYKCYRKRRYHVVQVQNSNYVFDVPSVHLSTLLLKYQNCDSDEIVKL